ncbi:excinuclease ABC subunit UvrB [Parendozoicomonas haliclonae]|uniref:UvrABC system protein B n=1 Tax=Parendozoicomonas haliclonae TaxID=1960125 RepID=A0A1X7ANH1_9GAMM|nr:excinuclease ABC subunit UvrB [Parendozoicomonas haliclonae]SMA49836.1 UvrABC system protein B [Parendozoicomonas haliclonae]
MPEGIYLLHSNHPPAGDQPEAIARLIAGIESGKTHQILKGVTGSGKTFTMANVIHRLERPALILAHNKTLAAQLYSEMKHFFPENAVEYFVSYYDYYQPEVYIPGSDRFIRKDSAINAHLERQRLSTTKSLIERPDVVVVASVSSIYGLGDPDIYRALQVPLVTGMTVERHNLIERLAQLQYERCSRTIERATFRVTGDVIDIFPADSEHRGVRVELTDNVISRLSWIDPVSGDVLGSLEHYRVSPKTLYSTPRDRIEQACEKIRADMEQRVEELNRDNRVAEAGRLYERTEADIEAMQLRGYCSGMENYAGYFNGRDSSLPPTTLMDYLPRDGLLFIDESHVMVPQISAMYRSDKSRKDTLVDYGFRLPSSHANRPLTFAEFEAIKPQTIFVSATPGSYELGKTGGEVISQLIRPTGLLDPEVQVRPMASWEEDLLAEIRERVARQERVLVTTLTKASAEALEQFMRVNGINANTLHSDVKTDDRIRLIKELRAGDYNVLIGINLLREGLDIPEASLVVILHADRAGFLRSVQALIQIIGRAARNANGLAILYADKITPAMQQAIDESSQRRDIQQAYNQANDISPRTPSRTSGDLVETAREPEVITVAFCDSLESLCHEITRREKDMLDAVDNQDEVRAKQLRQELRALYKQTIFMDA